jgi:hypothetical protein
MIRNVPPEEETLLQPRSVALHGSQARADDVSFTDFPYVVYCSYEGIDHAYYFS